MRSICSFLLSVCLASGTAWAAQARPKPAPTAAGDSAAANAGKPAKSDTAKAAKCSDHGVSKKLCTRCNPKLAPVFKAKGDWCVEHERPESQCALCHPELARKGVK